MKKPGFPEYGEEQLPKVNTMREDKSQPDFMGVPILRDGEVMLMRAAEIGNKPASCYTCIFKNAKDETCALIGEEIKVSKVTGSKDEGNPIEYWPCCSMHTFGEPSGGEPERCASNNPGAVGLIWINSPEVGQSCGGANCGGVAGGDDCDQYQVESGEKWDNPKGFCRVLQHEVSAGDVCAAWRDDDILEWQDAQQLMKQDSRGKMGDSEKKKLAREIVGRDE